MKRTSEFHSQAMAELALLTATFEELVAEAGARCAQIEQLLADMAAGASGGAVKSIPCGESGKCAA